MSFDEYVYTGTPSTNLYKYVDALCGTTGAGALVNEIFLARLSGALETIYFNDLDYIFGKINFLARSPAESYPYNPMQDLLTSAQWSEVRQKDAWYRARITDFFKACNLGGTPDGIRMCVNAALAVDCNIYEVWRYMDNFGLTEELGRSPVSSRNEFVVQPNKTSLSPEELRLVRGMLSKVCPVDTIITVNLQGLAVHSPIPVNAAASDSTYYEVQKMVTATPALANLPAPELLPIDLLPTQTWLYEAKTDPTLAPYAAFNITSEYGYYYLVGGGTRSPIDSVTYGTIEPGRTGTITVYECSGTTIQVTAENIVDRLQDDITSFVNWLGGVHTPAGGVQFPPIYPGPGAGYFANNLNSAEFNYVGIPYPAQNLPVNNAVATAQNTLVAKIMATPGPFILMGTAQGAMVVSNVYDMIRSGSLTSRSGDLLAGIVFSNPRRQAHHEFPNCPDPGGQGVATPNLINSDPFWWEFARPGDPLACNTTDAAGLTRAALFNILFNDFSGAPSGLQALLSNLGSGLMSVLTGIHNFYATVTGTDVAYGDWQPIAGDTRTAYELALAYIQAFADMPNTSVDPMSTYRTENNYQVFDTTGQYTAPIPYATADSPDNYPGGKFGIHPDSSPALNPDGTPYSFPWASQQAYVAAQVIEITNEGGLANANSYQLPLAPVSNSAQVFYPEYAIAYYPPAKESTVSTAITARHGDPTNQLTPDARNPVNFVRSS